MDDETGPTRPHNAEPGREVLRPGRWTCRMHLWHRWRTHRYPATDHLGERYQECLDCGKQRDMPVAGGTGLVPSYREDD